jgi:DNA-binding NarL/FixJ family response regulator
MSDKITVLLVDDHTLVRRGFRRLLEDDPAIVVAGEASDGEEAVRLAASLKPRVIVMDCAMPGTSGLIATRRILEADPDVVIVMLSMHSEATLVRQALDAGARGYILKDALDLDLAAAVKRAAAGEMVLDPKLTPQTALKGERVALVFPDRCLAQPRGARGRPAVEAKCELLLSFSSSPVWVLERRLRDSIVLRRDRSA